ncbi:MAG TPA: beta-galactosidase [Anaerolineales bacterium]|nr:beta-galactosidase [Anaerolineales bacterium]
MSTDALIANDLPVSSNAALGRAIPAERPMELWAFLENSDFVRRKGNTLYRQDEVELIRHDEFLEADYRLLVEAGCVGVRDAARWYLTHPAPGLYDWTWLDRVVAAADKHGLKLYLDLWHYGYPDWLDILSVDAPAHFAEFAREIALRYPALEYYCVCNEPSLLVEMGGRQGEWGPYLSEEDPSVFRRQVSRMIIEASRAILEIKPAAVMVLPEPWHATDKNPEDHQAAVIDTVLGLRDPELGGCSEYVTIIGLNHYRDSTLPPFHRLLLHAQKRWPAKQLWVTETSGPPTGWQQAEWFWWMLAETRLAIKEGVDIPVFTWAPAISMFDWVDETLQLPNGIWILDEEGRRLPNGKMLEAIELARRYNYIR